MAITKDITQVEPDTTISDTEKSSEQESSEENVEQSSENEELLRELRNHKIQEGRAKKRDSEKDALIESLNAQIAKHESDKDAELLEGLDGDDRSRRNAEALLELKKKLRQAEKDQSAKHNDLAAREKKLLEQETELSGVRISKVISEVADAAKVNEKDLTVLVEQMHIENPTKEDLEGLTRFCGLKKGKATVPKSGVKGGLTSSLDGMSPDEKIRVGLEKLNKEK